MVDIYLSAGEIAQTNANFAFPPRDSCNKNVNLESLYGICRSFPVWETSARIFIKFLQYNSTSVSNWMMDD